MQLNNVFENWLEASKISKKVQEDFKISFDENIIIPIYDKDNNFIFNKYRRNPLSEEKPKYWYDKGSKISLFGLNHIKQEHKRILLTEGEKDCLVSWTHNIPALTSTGGAMSFQEEWKEFFLDKDVIVCFDNDPAGASGMVKVIEYIPHARILLIPDQPNVKDISDYVSKGGDLETLLSLSRRYKDIEDIKQERSERLATFRSVFFHDAYIKAHTIFIPKNISKPKFDPDRVTMANNTPITSLLDFNSKGKRKCIFHNEKTPSMVYYPESNRTYCFGCSKTADSIEIYKKIHNCNFVNAVNDLLK